MKRRRTILANVKGIRSSLSKGDWRQIFGSLTYKPEEDYVPGQITAFEHRLRSYCRRHRFPFHFVWVAEPHQSGKPHYHYLWWVPLGVKPPMPDKQGWWPHGWSRVEYVKYSVGSYISKYISKTTRIHLNGMHTHGVSGLTGEGKRVRRVVRAPHWLKPRLDYFRSDIRYERGVWYDFGLGKWHVGPFEFLRRAGYLLFFGHRTIQSGVITEGGLLYG